MIHRFLYKKYWLSTVPLSRGSTVAAQLRWFSCVGSLKKGVPGYDEITVDTLRLSLDILNEPLCYLCNRSLIEGVFPNEMKLANVLPLFKSGDPMLFNNYRPVSLLCVLSKVFEKVMYSRLLSFIENHNLLFQYQFGFRQMHSSYMALMIMMDSNGQGWSRSGDIPWFLKGLRYRKPWNIAW